MEQKKHMKGPSFIFFFVIPHVQQKTRQDLDFALDFSLRNFKRLTFDRSTILGSLEQQSAAA